MPRSSASSTDNRFRRGMQSTSRETPSARDALAWGARNCAPAPGEAGPRSSGAPPPERTDRMVRPTTPPCRRRRVRRAAPRLRCKPSISRRSCRWAPLDEGDDTDAGRLMGRRAGRARRARRAAQASLGRRSRLLVRHCLQQRHSLAHAVRVMQSCRRCRIEPARLPQYFTPCPCARQRRQDHGGAPAPREPGRALLRCSS